MNKLFQKEVSEINKTLTTEEVMTKMKEAVKVVEQAGVPEDLRVAAFEKSFEALIGHGGVSSSVEAQANVARPTVTEGPSDGPSLAAIGARLGLDEALAEEIYQVDDSGPGLILAQSRFHATKAAGTQQIALLLAAGRQAGGWEEWTSVAPIRAAARDYGRFDPANFATTIKRMGDVFGFRGKGRKLEVRVTRPGYDRAGLLARDLSGAGA
jgi:hypothetical protein